MTKRLWASLGSVVRAAIVALAVSYFIYAPHASACSCFYLAYGFIGPYTSRLPANAIGIPWYVSTKMARSRGDDDWFVVDESRFILEVLSEDQFEPIPLRIAVAQEFATRIDTYMIYHIIPLDRGLRPGSTYRVTDQLARERLGESHGDRQVVVEIDHETLAADTPLILHVGNARVAALYVAANVSCIGGLRVSQATIAARLPSEFRKWEDQLLFQTMVNGQPWSVRRSLCSLVEPGRGWDREPVAHDRIFAACDEPTFHPISPILAPGSHTVSIEARLPGTDIVLQTGKQTVNLECFKKTNVLERASN